MKLDKLGVGETSLFQCSKRQNQKEVDRLQDLIGELRILRRHSQQEDAINAEIVTINKKQFALCYSMKVHDSLKNQRLNWQKNKG